MSEIKTIKPLLYDDHKRPATRREFLAQGLMGLAAYTVVPAALSTISWKAWAQAQNCEIPDNGFVPFMVFDMAGGGGLPCLLYTSPSPRD